MIIGGQGLGREPDVIPFPDQTMTLSASLAVPEHCPRFAFAYSPDLEME
jgi:hypothetical protein